VEDEGHEERGVEAEDLVPELVSPIHPLSEVEEVEESERLRENQVGLELAAEERRAIEFTVSERLVPSAGSNPTAFQAVSFEPTFTRIVGWQSIDEAHARFST